MIQPYSLLNSFFNFKDNKLNYNDIIQDCSKAIKKLILHIDNDSKYEEIIQKLEELNVDRIEVASARVSAGEFKAVKNITDWAKQNNYLSKVEILTFVDKGVSIQWVP